jgi:phosphate transport system substrate-binding protein
METMPVTATDHDARSEAWLSAVLAVVPVLAVIALGVLVLGSTGGKQPPFLAGIAGEVVTAPREDTGDTLVLAGSGSNLPVTRELAAAFAATGAPQPVVHVSIGSGGGIRALRDGVIDIALVSRALKPEERAQGLVAVPYARAPVIVAAHVSVPEPDISRAKLLTIWSGDVATWDDGTPLVVLQREQGDSSHSAVARVVPEFARVDDEAHQARRWRVLYTDDAMDEALSTTEGAIGLVGSGRIDPALAIRALDVDGVDPSVDHVGDGSYPFSKDLSFVTLGEPDARVREFIRFAMSPAGREIVREHGCLPLGGQGPTALGAR